MLLQFDEHPVLDSYAERMNMIGALVLRLIHQLVSTLEKLLREIRGNVPPTGDVDATQKRHRRMQRLQQAMTIANNVRSRR